MRFQRTVFSSLMLFFADYNVEFVSTTEKFDTSTPVGRAMLNICIVFAQLERETIQQRVSDAYHSRSKRGFFMGGVAPYGFKKEGTVIDGIKTSKFVINEEESAQIKLIFSMYADSSNSLSDIVRYLVKNDIQQLRTYRPWSTQVISRLLCNPVYVQSDLLVYEFFKSQGANIINDVSEFDGRACYMYRGTNPTKRIQTDITGKEIVIAPHEGFVSSDIWLKCRLRCLNNKHSTKTCKGKSSWLLGKLKCGNCGYAIAVSAKTKNGKRGVCSNRVSMKICNGTGSKIYMNLVEESVLTNVKDRLAKFQTLSDHTQEKIQPKVKENELKLIRLDNEITDLLTKVVGANAVVMEYINKKIDELNTTRKKLLQENISIAQTVKKDTLSTVYEHVENWEKISFEDKQSVADILIKVIHIKDGKINIDWNI